MHPRSAVRFALAALLLAAPVAHAAAPAKEKAVPVSECYGCHERIEGYHQGGKHAKVPCGSCHANLAAHAGGGETPVTRMDHAACGACHRDQYQSFREVNLKSAAKVEKSTYKSRSPLFDKLIAGHAFAKEHDEPRGHLFMLMDQFIVDRAFGGRFQLKDWTRILDARAAEGDPWSALTDAQPQGVEQMAFLPQTAAAANPVCVQCKTQDTILSWAYMGESHAKARWNRGSLVVELARSVRNPMNCFFCHDPHSARPRVVRDALIEAVVDRGLGTYPNDPEKSRQVTMEKVMFRGFRAIGLLSRPDANIMCAQCHVEYACNPGLDPRTTPPAKIGMGDRRTNFFPWTGPLELSDRYREAGFADFRHAVTGALLVKLQHPESETFRGSRHERAGLTCRDCHMPRVQGKDGKTYTWHGMKSVRYFREVACGQKACHPGWTQEEALYRIEAVQGYTRGKINKAEFWLGRLIDTYVRARDLGVGEEALIAARAKHSQAHVLWEWWTAENSDGFHNPGLARESLARSVTLSQEGIAQLEEAIAARAAPSPSR